MSVPMSATEPASDIPQEPVTPSSCPPPLAWSDVLREFQQGSSVWEAVSGRLRIQGRVWGTGRPLYFLNGISGSFDLHCLTAWLLKDDFRCVFLNWPDAARDLSQLVEAVRLSAEHLQDRQFDLFASSFGTIVALELMRTIPERLQHLVLQGPLTGLRLSPAERMVASLMSFVPGTMDRLPLRRRIAEANHQRWFPPFDATRWEFLLSESGRTPISAVARRARMLHRYQESSALKSVSIPTLIITSEGESIRHHHAAAALRAIIPGTQFESLSNSGHVPEVTHPHRLVKLMKPFLLDQPSA